MLSNSTSGTRCDSSLFTTMIIDHVCKPTLAHQSPPPPTVNTDSVVWADANAQTTRVIFAWCSPPVPVSSTNRLALTPFGLYDQPCRSSTFMFLFHELQLGTSASLVSSSHIPIASSYISFALSSVVAAALSAWLRVLGGWWWREERRELDGLEG
jgi:hypothetical protein